MGNMGNKIFISFKTAAGKTRTPKSKNLPIIEKIIVGNLWAIFLYYGHIFIFLEDILKKIKPSETHCFRGFRLFLGVLQRVPAAGLELSE